MMMGVTTMVIVMWMSRSVEGGAVLCSYCQLAVGALEESVDWQNITVAEVEAKLLPICSKLSTLAKRIKCKGAVTVGVPVILGDLSSKENPLALCGTLTFCSAPQSANCIKCQAAVKGAEVELKHSNATDEEIVDTFLPYCDKIANATEAKLCRLGLQAEGPNMIDQLRDGANPINFCGQFYICDISHPNPPPFSLFGSWDHKEEEEEEEKEYSDIDQD